MERVSMSDDSPENHFRAMDAIHKICGEPDNGGFDEGEIQRLSSSMAFLSEWRYFNYRPKTIRFMPEIEFSNGKETHNDITLSQFSAASVPRFDLEAEKFFPAAGSTDSRKDFLLYVGGLVWALDWCPRPEQGTQADTKCEFLAVASHPPDSTYNKLGTPLTGCGMIQIWCLVNCSSNKVDMKAPDGKIKRKYPKKTLAEKEEDKTKKPRGRPRKNPIDKIPAIVGPEREFSQALVELPENILDVPPVEDNILNSIPSLSIPGPVDSIEQKSEKNAVAQEVNKPKKSKGRPKKIPVDKTVAFVGAEGLSTQAFVAHPSGDIVNVHPSDVNELRTLDPQKEKVKKQKDKIRKSAIDISPVVLDAEGQFSQALIVHPSEGTSNVPLVENPTSQKWKGKKQKGVKGKSAMDKDPFIMDIDDQFTQALSVHSFDHTSNEPPMDENLLITMAPLKEKRRKRKSATAKKNMVDDFADTPDSEEALFEALAVEFPENMPHSFSTEEDTLYAPAAPQGKLGKRRKIPTKKGLHADLEYTISELKRRSRGKSKLYNNSDLNNRPTQNEGEGLSLAGQQKNCLEKENIVLGGGVASDGISNLASNVQKDVLLPRVVLCLGHDGKVAWDVKWRPLNACDSVPKHIMGYLAVVLGNGSVEVWEIPSPQMIKCIYASQHGDAINPRFAKLKPVFRCSKLKIGNSQSMPLTVEWSASPPHDLILAGCHDGMVALWKFCADNSSQDARPLLCFRAETVPIRALSWAPFEGDTESANLIVTAGHGGLKFWDLRDPFRPLWDANPSQRYIYSLDWLPDPRCILVSYDDGTVRMVSISKAAYDIPVTGEPFTGTLQQGVHSYCCSPLAVWSIHMSRQTGMVAYCCADGTVLYFQLTHKAVDKDPLRNRSPHFLCGSLVDEDPVVAVNTHLPSFPHLMKKSATEWTNIPRPARSVASGLNQAKRVRKGKEKSQKSDEEVLALSYVDDHIEGDIGEAQTSPLNRKGKGSESKKTIDEKALTFINENEGSINGKPGMKDEVDIEIEVPPSKIISMYKVRWNMNKGSERWLCYGGAAGIVRCQQIDPPVFDKKLLRRGPS